MGHGLLKKIFAYPPRDAANDTIACFGKLPFHRELIRYQLNGDAHFYWQQWLQDGFSDLNDYYGHTLPQVFPRMPAWQFMLIDDRQKYFLLGTLVASCDKQAQCFPFSVFRKVNTASARQYASMMPLVYKEILAAEKLLCLKGWETENKTQFFESLTALRQYHLGLNKTDIESLENNILNILNLGVMQQGLLEQHGIEDFPQFLTQMHHHLHAFAKAVSEEKHCGIQIPLPVNKLSHSFVVFWLSLIEKWMGRSEKRLWVFWNHAYLMVYYPRLLPSYFRHLIEPTLPYDGLVNARYVSGQRHSPPTEMTCLSNQLNLSLLDVLKAWI